jgi:hypothetical protein
MDWARLGRQRRGCCSVSPFGCWLLASYIGQRCDPGVARMIDLYLLAFVAMPVVLAALGVAYALLAERFERQAPKAGAE